MKKKSLMAALCMLILLGSLLLCLVASGIIVFDHSAQRRGEGVFWQDVLYVPCSGMYNEGKTISKTDDGWSINEVEEDDTHTFIVLRSFLDDCLLVREDYRIPTEGALTKAVWGGKVIHDEQFLSALSDLLSNAASDFSYETEGIFQSTQGQQMRYICVAFKDCPVATQNLGYIGTINGTWYITTEISDDQYNEEGRRKHIPYGVIPSQANTSLFWNSIFRRIPI